MVVSEEVMPFPAEMPTLGGGMEKQTELGRID
jgi:hypothetical protein